MQPISSNRRNDNRCRGEKVKREPGGMCIPISRGMSVHTWVNEQAVVRSRISVSKRIPDFSPARFTHGCRKLTYAINTGLNWISELSPLSQDQRPRFTFHSARENHPDTSDARQQRRVLSLPPRNAIISVLPKTLQAYCVIICTLYR